MALYPPLLHRMDVVTHVLCPIFDNARKTPQQLALITEERSWSYFELDQAINTICHFLNGSGIKKGERIAFVAKTQPSTILLLFALFRLGAIACPLSFRIPKAQLPSPIFDPETLPLNGEREPCRFESIALEESATSLLTSGSSGIPKAACHTFANHYYSAIGAIRPLQLEPSSRWLLSLPLFHVGGIGILMRCFYVGASVVLSDRKGHEAIAKFGISHLSQVPTQLYRLLKEPDLTFIPHLKCLLLGGAPISSDLVDEALNKNIPLFSTYGMTEMSSMITLSQGDPSNAGKVLPHRELKVEKDGEIWVRGKTLFEGYLDSATQTIVKQADWFPTKDLGRFTEKGDLEIIGRKDRQFISGGENIQPEEIEKALCAVPGILQASVLPVSDLEFGKRPLAFVQDETGSHTLESIREALESAIPSFKHPIAVLPYPDNTGLKPSLSALKQYLNQTPEWASRSQE